MSKTIIISDVLDTDDIISGSLYTHTEKVDAGALGKAPTNPPAMATAGITAGMKYTVGTDKSNVIFKVTRNYESGDGLVWFNWTKSATGADESTKQVKWQIKYLEINPGVNCNTSEATLSVEDTYDDSDLTSQIIYNTAQLTIPEASLTAGGSLALEVSAIAPSGTALGDEPLLLSLAFQCSARHIV